MPNGDEQMREIMGKIRQLSLMLELSLTFCYGRQVGDGEDGPVFRGGAIEQGALNMAGQRYAVLAHEIHLRFPAS